MKIFDKLKIVIDPTFTVNDRSNAFLCDVSGRDSIAAIINILEEYDEAVIVPTVVKLSVEYGDKNARINLLDKLSSIFGSHRFIDGLLFDVDELWKLISTYKMQHVIRHYKFYTPCIACHLSFHLIRILIAKKLKILNVVSGERIIHTDKEKINQLGFVLDFYNEIYKSQGVNHILPVRNIIEGSQIDKLLYSYGIECSDLNCLYSGNYYEHGTSKISIRHDQIYGYLYEILHQMLNGMAQEIEIKCVTI